MKIEHIVTGTDFSEAAERGLDAAFDLARHFRVPVSVLHVFHHPISVDPETAPTNLAEAETFLNAARDAAEKQLAQRVTEKTAGTGITADWRVLDGAPYDAIAKACKPGDLLVVSTHGRTGAKRLLLGSVAERLVQHAPCPVLTVPSKETEETV